MMPCSLSPLLFLSYISALREFLEMHLVLWERWGWGVVAEEGGGMIGGRICLPLLTFVFILAFRNILMSQKTIIETLFIYQIYPSVVLNSLSNDRQENNSETSPKSSLK